MPAIPATITILSLAYFEGATMTDSNQTNATGDNTTTTVSNALLLAHLMPKTYAALIANGGSISQLAQALPATSAALSGALR